MKEEKNILLDDKQVKVFMIALEKLRDDDPNFKDATCDVFEDYVYRRAMQLAFEKRKQKKVFKNGRMYEISDGMFKYISYVTSEDVLDKENVEEKIKSYNSYKEKKTR